MDVTTVAGAPGVDFPAPGYPGITYVIPCGGAKADHPAQARDLYVGSMFRHTLAAAERMVALDVAEGRGPARVLILSARYGLVGLDEVLEPYDLRMESHGSVTVEVLAAQALTLGIDWGSDVYALLPRPYLARLDSALRTLDVYVQDVYEGCGGIGEQKRVNVCCGWPPDSGSAPDREEGLVVWHGGDVSSLWWNIPVLVSYGRLREAKTLPVAGAPWVCDSRAFTEIGEHGRWTIDARQYVADLDRYARQIGRLVWVAPQDWPVRDELLERTGLSEEEHQALTIASVRELRAMAPHLPVICVVTGNTPASCLRHVDMYLAAGIDLRAESLVVGVGGLVGRPRKVIAEIVRALHGAGLRRLHGFGVKGPALELIGHLLESIDSAAWSDEARRRDGLCPHGVVKWERNCPQAAVAWGIEQRRRAALAGDTPPAGSISPWRSVLVKPRDRRRQAGSAVGQQLLPIFDMASG